jgi:uncharacterized protein
MERLPEGERQQIGQRIAELGKVAARPITCPFLNRESGACRIYDVRPVACRTYGFYVEREGGLFCGTIQERVAQGAYDDVVWGNQASVDAELAQFGESVDLLSWWLSSASRQTSEGTRQRAEEGQS